MIGDKQKEKRKAKERNRKERKEPKRLANSLGKEEKPKSSAANIRSSREHAPTPWKKKKKKTTYK